MYKITKVINNTLITKKKIHMVQNISLISRAAEVRLLFSHSFTKTFTVVTNTKWSITAQHGLIEFTLM